MILQQYEVQIYIVGRLTILKKFQEELKKHDHAIEALIEGLVEGTGKLGRAMKEYGKLHDVLSSGRADGRIQYAPGHEFESYADLQQEVSNLQFLWNRNILVRLGEDEGSEAKIILTIDQL